MATDKIKVAVRVRPFNRRGKYNKKAPKNPQKIQNIAISTVANKLDVFFFPLPRFSTLFIVNFDILSIDSVFPSSSLVSLDHPPSLLCPFRDFRAQQEKRERIQLNWKSRVAVIL